MGKSRNKQGLLDTLIGEMLNYGAEDDQSVMDIIFSGDQKSISSIPLRYRIIGLGFVRKMSLEELNEKLEANGCEKLYGRSIYEASLMHAFNSGMSYAEWKELFSVVSKIRERIPADEHLSGSAVSLNDISAYVEDNSDFADNILKTQHVTQQISGSLAAIPADRRALLDFMIKNLQSFSLSRECTRYYFCKYMMYYLATRRDYFVNALKNDPVKTQKELASGMDSLAVFRAQSKLTRKNYTPEEAREVINESPVSLSAVYDEYQQFYFDYTSIDWMTVMLERYSDLGSLSSRQKKSLAESIRRYQPSVSSYSDDEVIEWQMNEMEEKEKAADEKYSSGSSKAPAPSRTGETFLRKVLHGKVDLDRTTFLSFILFFDKGSNIPPEHRISRGRLREILLGCGFNDLNDDDPFDAFFIDYMQADDPMVFLIEEAEIMAMSEENFYLYKTYLSSKDNDNELTGLVK